MWNIEKNENIIQKLEILAKQRFNDPEAKANKIKENLYSLETDWNINEFVDEKWKVIANPAIFSEYDHYKEYLGLAWYEEKKDWNLLKMYRLKDWKEIGKYSLEYFQIWVDINFYEWYRLAHLSVNNRLSINQLKRLLPRLIEAWSFRIKDLVPFLKRKQISEPDFEKELPKLRELLKTQVMDVRLEKIKDEITESEIKSYLENWHISKDLARELYDLLKLREEKKKNKEIEEWAIHSQTRTKTKEII
ncbi:MAG: hypothetical protein ACD_4C00105G0003 [uncultured bacterium (gcode 4)]|uniref:Uncharacterized protein n=1 Tax=uncultured bacterium (gcode 4) TaxID=1234023 RepID=K2F741_9BACT|nr:MAG: hypothetical protein ACD_4C00105G0003 [uncultured bacterium (gcode 4)]